MREVIKLNSFPIISVLRFHVSGDGKMMDGWIDELMIGCVDG